MMEKKGLPELNIHLDKIVKLEGTETGLLMTYSFRPFLLWIFLAISALLIVMMYFTGLEAPVLVAAIFSSLAFISFFKGKVFDKCQIEFGPREIICKRGYLFSKVTVFRRYHMDELNIESKIESGHSQHGTVEHYSTVIHDQYCSFTIYSKSISISLLLVKTIKECEEWSKK